jgi:hypothetical protein
VGKPGDTSAYTEHLFQLLPSSQTGIDFKNTLKYDSLFNVFTYRNFYNGGGVALGDVNNDGLPDIYFTANMGPNKLYLNLGNWKFREVASLAGVSGNASWSTGVTMADINGDGWLDIYVCNSGNPRSDETADTSFNRQNECFINRGSLGLDDEGVPHFTESARSLGIADPGLSTHAAFFDYDRDGDLDLYMLNNSFQEIGNFDLSKNLRYQRDSLGGDKLYQNVDGVFVDKSTEAGILGSVIAFGLGVTIGDVDMDGWQDIYVSNDFFERDYLYKNQGDGTFKELLTDQMRHISASSMGADMADINNDAYPDIFVTDMLPESDRRLKTTAMFDSPDRFNYSRKMGYYNQFTRNMLHLNNADGSFSEIACLGNLEATDWSWGALLFDMDLDGWRDVFVANGIAKDLTDGDYLLFASDMGVSEQQTAEAAQSFKRLMDSIPSEQMANYAFRNTQNLRFENTAKAWGLDQKSFSNGSAYGDLDGDGDLDLVVNNVDAEAFVYRNHSREQNPENAYLKFEFKGAGKNTWALGAKVFIRSQGKTFYQENMPIRGFQSCMDHQMVIGLGNMDRADSILVEWPNGKSTLILNEKTNTTLQLRIAEANIDHWMDKSWLKPAQSGLLEPVSNIGADWTHKENAFYDWDRDRLLYFLYSTEGPRLAVADVNGDGLEDFYVGGAAGQSGVLFIQNPKGTFDAKKESAFQTDARCEDVDAVFFDADGDGDQDLYVASGGNESKANTSALSDRLYFNDGLGHFKRNFEAVSRKKAFASACVRAADVDGDGDLDLFTGMRLLPGKVGVPVGGFILLNNGKGYFAQSQPEALKNLGMLTDAVWEDLNKDGMPDLLVTGEWMPVKVFINKNGLLIDETKSYGLDKTNGLWKRIRAVDLNEDGKMDFVLGNNGLNSRLKTDPGTPITLYFNDFDHNGTPEQIICRYTDGKLLPYLQRTALVEQLPSLKKRYLHFSDYVDQTMESIFTEDQLENALVLEADHLANSVLISKPNGGYTLQDLPPYAQFAPLYGITSLDVNQDGHKDLLLAGNFTGCKPEFGFMDAEYGTVLLGDGTGQFTVVRSNASGFKTSGEVRDLKPIQAGKETLILSAQNNAPLEVFKVKKAAVNQ